MSTLGITTTAGLDFLIRFIAAGSAYGRGSVLTADRPMIEFYAGPEFIARYRVEDFGDTGSVQLAMGGSYYLDHDAADAVREWLSEKEAAPVVDRSEARARVLALHRDPSRPPFPGAVAMTCSCDRAEHGHEGSTGAPLCGTHILWVNPPLPPNGRTLCKVCR